jgi:predicted O-methyltransferase YrrM
MIIDETIPGWTSPEKLMLFADIATWAGEINEGPRPHILEIGSWAGRSLVAWAANCPHGTVFSVDSSRGYTLTELKQRDPSVFEFMRGDPDRWDMWDTKIEVTRQRVAQQYKNIELFQMTSDEFFQTHWAPFDVIFVDGSHEEDFVYRDISNSSRYLRHGGLLCGDDYAWPGVKMAVDRYVAENGLILYIHPTITDLWVIVRGNEISWWL